MSRLMLLKKETYVISAITPIGEGVESESCRQFRVGYRVIPEIFVGAAAWLRRADWSKFGVITSRVTSYVEDGDTITFTTRNSTYVLTKEATE